jgi:hypothetical protein
MDSGQLTAVLIVAIIMITSVARVRYGYGRFGRNGRRSFGAPEENNAENQRLREEVHDLKERIKVLERITVEKENSLAKEIDSLRDR